MKTGSDFRGRVMARLKREKMQIVNLISQRIIFTPANHVRDAMYKTLRPAEYFTMKRPAGFDEKQWKIFTDAIQSKVPASRLLDLVSARVIGNDSWVFTQDMEAVTGMWDRQGAMTEKERIRLLKLPSKLGVEQLQHLDGTTLLLNQVVAGNYYHFTHQVIPRIALAREYIDIDKIDHFITPRPVRGFMLAWLELAGIPVERVRPMVQPGFTCERLIMTSNPGPHNVAPAWSIDYLRGLVPQYSASDVPRRVFISRKDAPARRLLNHDVIEALLQDYGFEQVTLSGLTVSRQAEIFRRADIVVAVHGAALANLVFAHPDLRLVELLPNNHVQPTFWTLGQQLGLDHRIVMGSEEPLRFRRLRRDTRADLTIEPDSLREHVSELASG